MLKPLFSRHFFFKLILPSCAISQRMPRNHDKSRKRRLWKAGFTLVEALVTLSIAAILAALALPSYQVVVRKSNRADAKITLNKLSARQERYYLRTNQYAVDFADLFSGVASGSPIDSDKGHYSITLNANTYAWSMKATGQGEQVKDSECSSLTLTNLGSKTALDANLNSSDKCW